MKKEITLQLTTMAHGGSALGQDDNGRFIFVPLAIPGETVRVAVPVEKKEYAQGKLLAVETAVSDRVSPQCPHFGECGGCHFQHIAYTKQLAFKQDVVKDQLQRLGGIKNANVLPTLPNANPWAYRQQITLFPAKGGGLGYWSPAKRQIIPITQCPIADPRLMELLQDIDLDLPELRKMTLRVDSEGELLAAMEVTGVEPPALEIDFPVSVAIVLPDNTAASLVGDYYSLYEVNGRSFRVSPGCPFPPSLSGAEQISQTVTHFVSRHPQARIIQAYSGTGWLTAAIAPLSAGVIAIEPNPDAVADSAVNLDSFDNIHIYEDDPASVIYALDVEYDVLVIEPPSDGLTKPLANHIRREGPPAIIYISSDLATMARDSKQLARAGYRLVAVQPIDVQPQTFHIDTVSYWVHKQYQ